MEGVKILIVDDDSSVRRILARTFERAGFVVSMAPNGEKALSVIAGEEERFEVLICDISMPKMNGRQFCQHLAGKGPYLPGCTFIVTSCAGSEEVGWVDEIPGVSLIEKPVGPRRLLQHVQRHLTMEFAADE